MFLRFVLMIYALFGNTYCISNIKFHERCCNRTPNPKFYTWRLYANFANVCFAFWAFIDFFKVKSQFVEQRAHHKNKTKRSGSHLKKGVFANTRMSKICLTAYSKLCLYYARISVTFLREIRKFKKIRLVLSTTWLEVYLIKWSVIAGAAVLPCGPNEADWMKIQCKF